MVLAMPEEIRLPGATYADVALADFLAALAAKVRRNDASLREFRAGQQPAAPAAPAAPDARLKIEEVARQVRAALGAGTALLVETFDPWCSLGRFDLRLRNSVLRLARRTDDAKATGDGIICPR